MMDADLNLLRLAQVVVLYPLPHCHIGRLL
jgi:hypothetical protein